MKSRWNRVAAGACGAAFALGLTSGAAAQRALDPARIGVGWRMERLDVDVDVQPDAERIEVEGAMTLVLKGIESSFGPTIALNRGRALMTFERVDGPAGAAVELNERHPEYESVRLAHIRFSEAAERGARLELSFAYSSDGGGGQFFVTEHGAIASWTDSWLPFVSPRVDLGEGVTVALLSVPGEMKLRLPPGWSGVSDGELIERTESADGAIEHWRLERPTPRSYAAGPYEVATRTIDGRTIRVAMTPGEKVIGVDRLAELLGATMAAQEAKWGPFPFPSYGVVEVPAEIAVEWYAASQQTFIMAKSSAFDYDHGNIPLWGHEMAHGWWGNTVSAMGTGSKWCSESLAQLGALIAIETMEGEAAAREFLGYSRSGYSPVQCAMGYFFMSGQGKDKPIAQLTGSSDDHTLSDNKGYWIYHMLRQVVGDEVFFGVQRDLIEKHRGKNLTVDNIREAYIAAAPELDLASFFAQWLDRTGAPVLEMDWHGADRGSKVVVTLTQTQPGEPFTFDLDIELTMLDGSTHVETVRIDEAGETFEFEAPGYVESVRLDPAFKLLIYRPGYGPRPSSSADEGG